RGVRGARRRGLVPDTHRTPRQPSDPASRPIHLRGLPADRRAPHRAALPGVGLVCARPLAGWAVAAGLGLTGQDPMRMVAARDAGLTGDARPLGESRARPIPITS